MDPSLLISLITPMVTFSAGLAVMVHYFHGKKEETDYEKEIKELRHSLIQGKLDRKSYLYIRDNLKVEDLFDIETKRLDNMFEQKMIDEVTYTRMKKVLQNTFNDKLVKIQESQAN
jgi:hypothetical protein